MRFLSALAIAREVDLTSFIAPTPLPIKGDLIQLQQVILNLIVNAMDAMSGMPSAERRITVSTARDGNSADLSVSDVGPGIPVEKLKEVFEPFFTTKPQGMGMGLSIARTIVELCPSSTERQLCVNQIVRALIQIKQEFRWGRSLSAGAGGRALARRIAARASGCSAV